MSAGCSCLTQVKRLGMQGTHRVVFLKGRRHLSELHWSSRSLRPFFFPECVERLRPREIVWRVVWWETSPESHQWDAGSHLCAGVSWKDSLSCGHSLSARLLCASQMSSLCGCAVLMCHFVSLKKAQKREIGKGGSQTSPAWCTLKPWFFFFF